MQAKMTNRALPILMVLVMLMGIITTALPTLAGALPHVYWYEYGEDQSYSDTQVDPNIITIHSEDDFAALAFELVDEGMIFDGNPATVRLAADLDLSEYLWFPVDLSNVTFDGQGHTIEGLRIEDLLSENPGGGDSGSYEYCLTGLFSEITDSTVQNLVIKDPRIGVSMSWSSNGETAYVGVIAGTAQSSQIREVYIYDPAVALTDLEGSNEIGNVLMGGLVGYSHDGTIINGAEIYGGRIVLDAQSTHNPGSAVHLGGLVGANYDSVIANGAVYDTFLSADIAVEDIDLFNMGGIVGYTSAEEKPYLGFICVMNSISTARFSSPDQLNTNYGYNVGGIAGEVYEDNVVNTIFIDTVNDVADPYLFGVVSQANYTVDDNYHVFNHRADCVLVEDRTNDKEWFDYSEIIDRLNGATFDHAVALTAANMGQSEQWVKDNEILKTWVFLPETVYYAQDTPGFGPRNPIDELYQVTVINGSGSGEYHENDVVTIVADAAPAGQVFAGWVSADGVVFANAMAATTTFIMPPKNVTVTATYKVADGPNDGPNPTPPPTGDSLVLLASILPALGGCALTGLARYRKRDED